MTAKTNSVVLHFLPCNRCSMLYIDYRYRIQKNPLGSISCQSIIRLGYWVNPWWISREGNANHSYRCLAPIIIRDLQILVCCIQILCELGLPWREHSSTVEDRSTSTVYWCIASKCVKSWPDLMTKQNWYTKTFPQEYGHELFKRKFTSQ